MGSGDIDENREQQRREEQMGGAFMSLNDRETPMDVLSFNTQVLNMINNSGLNY